ncbi:alpha-methylacyl-CoA racemase [Pararge aegeria]|uniref:Jg7173 protein n=2 Tax=Pararge aegeria TaxID=116150 RepID=A0A8S4RAR9_9NEOP|nr:alpha-methylacyl-CoA racemase [Pararge aegeria]CAH2231760.1 jg7173 [Pararge aegeria aegeria]
MALRGIKVLEMMGLAPGPFCGAILADFGASVTVVQKIESSPVDVLSNGKRTLSINLKCKDGVEIFKKLSAESDVLIDTFRPGVLEKLGLGPEPLMALNSRLIYARLTGYGQNGDYKDKAGHDINYIALSGILSMLSKNQQPPTPPINLVADFAGGSLLCTLGILLALFERMKSGKGQIIDASMTEGAAYLGTWLFKSQNLPIWSGQPGTNTLDGGLPSYATYKTKDSKFMAVGALEPQFYSNFLKGLELCEETYSQFDTECKNKFKEIFLTKTQQEWSDIFENLDACVTPVLDLRSVYGHACNSSRKSFYKDHDNLIVPEPAPRLSSTPGISSGKQEAPELGYHTVKILQELGYSKSEICDLIKKNVVNTKAKSNL